MYLYRAICAVAPEFDRWMRTRYVGAAMANRAMPTAGDRVNSVRLSALLDKLVPVQLDLEAMCGERLGGPHVVLTQEAVAKACEALQSSIADLRNIIHQVDGLRDLPPKTGR